MPNPKVKIHCGSAYVKGRARTYRYVIAQLFIASPRQRDGIYTYRSTGVVAGPFRGWNKAQRAAKELAERHGAEFIEGYGSLHGKEASA